MLDATVETAAYVLSRPVSNASVWCRLVNVPDKASALSGCLKALNQGAASEDVFMVPSGYFSSFPGAPFAYWAPSTIIDIFRELPPFQQGGRIVRCGMGTLDDFRFLRTWWEVPASGLAESRQETEQGRTWVAFAKPGEAAPFASDTKLVVNWGSNGRELKTYVESRVGSASRKVQSESLYFRSGLQFGRRVRRFSPAILPPGQIFSDSANAVFVDDESDLLAYLALLSGSPVRLLWSLFAPLRKMEVGYLQRLPVPIVDSDDEELVALARAGVRDALYRLQSDETSRYFNPGVLSQELPSALLDRSRLDEIVASKYGLDSTTLGILAANAEAQPAVDDGPNPWGLDKHTIVSLRVGSAFGRFDLGSERTCEPDISLLERPAPRPGALRPQVDENAQHDYREAMVLDAGHPLDIAAVVACPPHSGGDPQDASKHDVLFTSTDVLVGDYLSRKFFQEHIKRYAVGARRAPVYWQLSTVSSSYSVWLYYHTVSRDSLFRLLNDFILPKLHHEERQLHRLAQEAESGRTFVQRTEIDAQRTLIDELSVFRDEVERVAPLWDPDLNDGVLVNFAPLWRLVPHVRPWQREAKDCWSKLTRGEYDWAHLAMHLWPERVVPKCAEDRSLAIAHGLEDTFWVERDDGKWAQREVDAATVERLVQERSSAAVKAALADLLAAG